MENEEHELTIGSPSDVYSDRYFCKICGVQVYSESGKTLCTYCKAPVCSKCDIAGFCLNCFLNLHPEAQKSLKLSKILVWAVPLLLAFIVRGEIMYWIFAVLGSCALFIFFHFMLRFKISKNPDKYFQLSWKKTIHSPEYQEFVSDDRPTRVISRFSVQPGMSPIQHVHKNSEPSYNEDDEIETIDGYQDIPIPAHLDERYNKNNFNDEEFEEEEDEVKSDSRLGIEPSGNCPNCKNRLERGNICIECEIKVCPLCGESSQLSASRCLCGFEFPSPEDIFS